MVEKLADYRVVEQFFWMNRSVYLAGDVTHYSDGKVIGILDNSGSNGKRIPQLLLGVSGRSNGRNKLWYLRFAPEHLGINNSVSSTEETESGNGGLSRCYSGYWFSGKFGLLDQIEKFILQKDFRSVEGLEDIPVDVLVQCYFNDPVLDYNGRMSLNYNMVNRLVLTKK